MPEHEPFPNDGPDRELDALRDAWRALESPAATPEGDEVDPLTRASVAWLREAWSAVEPPSATPPARLVWSARLRGARRNAPILAAAAALVAFALFVWRMGPREAAERPGERVAQAPPEVDASNDAQPVSGAPGVAAGDVRAETAPPRRAERAPTVVASAPEPNAIVLEQGSVRLVLLDADEVTTTIEHEPELNPAGRREAPATPEEGPR